MTQWQPDKGVPPHALRDTDGTFSVRLTTFDQNGIRHVALLPVSATGLREIATKRNPKAPRWTGWESHLRVGTRTFRRFEVGDVREQSKFATDLWRNCWR